MTGISASGYALLGLTIIVAVLVAILAYAVMRFGAAARDSRRHLGEGQTEHAFLATALTDAIARLKAQERAMAARAEASERLSTEIIEGLTSGLILIDRGREVQIVNPSARKILRIELSTEPDEQNRGGSSLDRPDLVPLAAVIDEALQTGTAVTRRTVRIEAEEGPSFLGVTVSPLLDASGSAHAAICLFTDITQALALEEQLRLKEALARLGELTAGLAHELRNGLATIQGYAQLLDPQALGGSQRAYLEGIRGETHDLGDVVTRFLEFARPGPMTLAPVDLDALVSRVVADAPAGDAEVLVSGRFGIVDGDEVLLRQAIGNLVRNAIEACSGAGLRPRVHIQGEIDADGRALRLTVADDGPGIPKNAIGSVFHPFFTTRAQGTGLGLAIVQKVVVGHNGRIAASNRPEGGAMFRVTLPLLAETQPSRKA